MGRAYIVNHMHLGVEDRVCVLERQYITSAQARGIAKVGLLLVGAYFLFVHFLVDNRLRHGDFAVRLR